MIELQNVNKTYLVGESPLRALQDVNITIEAGEHLSVMGPSCWIARTAAAIVWREPPRKNWARRRGRVCAPTTSVSSFRHFT